MHTVVSEMLPPSWATGPLDISDSVSSDTAQLRDLFNACGYVEPWDPTFAPTTTDEQIAEMITRTEATRGGGDERFTFQSIRMRETGELAGYFHLSYGLPRPEIIWLSMMVIHPDFQRRSFSHQVINSIAERMKELGYNAIWLKVYLKNEPAFRHWIKAGFTKIVEWRNESSANNNPISALILERTL